MPQMAPVMWQFIYISCMILLLTTISKNFFSIFFLKKTEFEKKIKTSEMNWKW